MPNARVSHISINGIRKRLIGLGPEQLANVLLRLAARSDNVDHAVKRLVSPPEKSVSAFKSKLAAISKSNRFVDWRGASDFALELDRMLDDLKGACDNPAVGLELVAEFFRSDEQIFEHCDDSGGYVGTVFQCSACDLFVHYASKYPDKLRVIDLIVDLNETDEYGVRGDLINAAHRFLSKEMLRALAERLRQKLDTSQRSYSWSSSLASVARQLNDAPLYEEALRKARPNLHPRQYSDIAKAYLEAGDAETALSWIKRAESETSGTYFDGHLLLDVYLKLGRVEKAQEVAWQMFRDYRSMDSLARLLSIIGEDKREQVIADEVAAIVCSGGYEDSDAEFLVDVGRIGEAAGYILVNVDKLDGGYYSSLLPIAEAMEKHKHLLAAIAIYRALLDSILARGVSKYYHHGVRYMEKLDQLGKSIDGWGELADHAAYKSSLRVEHGRKTAFWSRYGKE